MKMTSQWHLFTCCKTGDLKQLRYLCEEEVDLNIRDCWDSTPLYYACLCGHIEIVEFLLNKGAKCVENTFDGERCLYGALTNDIKCLLKSWKQVHVTGVQRNRHYDMLNLLLHKGPYTDVKFIVHGKDFLLHKVILSARSMYFANAFSKKWKNKNVIVVTNKLISATAFSLVVQYLYTGRVIMHRDDITDVKRIARNCQLIDFVEDIDEADLKIQELVQIKPVMETRLKMLAVDSSQGRKKLLCDFKKLVDHVIPPSLHNWLPEGVLPFTKMWRMVGLHPDVSFSVNGHLFLSHKAFLCSSSEYFRAILEDHFKENVDNVLEDCRNFTLNNMSHEIFRIIVIFIYTGCLETSNEAIICETLCTSHMLLFHDLSRKCGQMLESFLSDNNVTQYYKMSRSLELPRLETSCIRFMGQNLEKLLLNDDFAALVEEDAMSISRREEVDSIPVIDDIRCYLTDSVQCYAQMHDVTAKLQALDVLLSRLGREC
uniref:Ankyrin repeat and BTB/POZ domain-containing protein 1 n=1 Tax=Phallusia mammillata TaxID=59560 RepID=A0A6F9D6F2_9ASCI|nr:ankyrin repeat and BTB/POZ domain-containing protein 1 [Phallusia mammillata]